MLHLKIMFFVFYLPCAELTSELLMENAGLDNCRAVVILLGALI